MWSSMLISQKINLSLPSLPSQAGDVCPCEQVRFGISGGLSQAAGQGERVHCQDPEHGGQEANAPK